jgi:hypothetical protein
MQIYTASERTESHAMKGGRVTLWETILFDRDKALPNKLGRGLLKHTQRRIADLEVKLAQEKASILPVRKLPFDILSEIFRICCMEERLAIRCRLL